MEDGGVDVVGFVINDNHLEVVVALCGYYDALFLEVLVDVEAGEGDCLEGGVGWHVQGVVL